MSGVEPGEEPVNTPDARPNAADAGTASADTASADTPASETPKRATGSRWLRIAVLIVFGLLYAYDLFEAIGNALGVNEQIAAYNDFIADHGLTPQSVPWGILGTCMALPPIAYAIAWWVGRRRSVLMLAFLLLVGLAVVAALTLSLTALVAVFPF